MDETSLWALSCVAQRVLIVVFLSSLTIGIMVHVEGTGPNFVAPASPNLTLNKEVWKER